MSFILEELPYQRQAIDAVVHLFDGQQRNYFDFEFQGDCFPNRLEIPRGEIVANVEKIAAENGILHGEAHVCIDPDYCIEMETGTGKTLVYLRDLTEDPNRPFFICLERALTTTTKWNLKHFLGNHFNAF